MAKTATPPLPPQRALDEKFQLARVAAFRLWPYLAPGLFRLVPRWTDGYDGLLTLAVDRYWRVYLNRRFVAGLSPIELALLLACHELQHLLLGHMVRLEGYRGIHLVTPAGERIELVNLANDLAINCRLPDFIEAAKATYAAQQKSHLFPESLVPPENTNYPKDFTDKTGTRFPDYLLSEDYAERLLAQADNKVHVASCRCGSGAGGSDGSSPWEDPTPPTLGDQSTGVCPDEAEVVRQSVAKAAAEAARKTQGTVPGHLQMWAEARLAPPRVRWEDELRRVVRIGIDELAGRVDSTYSRPNRRTAGTSVILPGTVSYAPRLAVVFDTSGSMGPADYDRVFSEIRGLIQAKATGSRGVPCIACDAAAAQVQWVHNVRDIRMVGGGGTDMMSGIHAAKTARGLNPGLVIVLTDGYTSWDAVNPYPGTIVLAVLTNRDATPPPDWVRTVYACD